ncbi:nucleotide exchange factor GrpE [Paenibacillus montaniterrae]|uniref:Protein GrpE n=1 Tax=Paenibacillus montaniterrae TaxID=429341 RepID=A0A919YLB3_9BACL|nr:nucleotide exchange factor GrpE [Paenibacillus montaniterrae]GIP15342.1 nucleotide exchange factor GrpE [Paenibacillus montaniterrae]
MSKNEQNNEFVDQEEQNLEENAHEEMQDTAQHDQEDEQEHAAEPEGNEEVEQLRKQLEEANNRLLRVQADYDNFRRRTLKEKEELAKYASAKLVENLLPSIDNFDRALAASASTGDYESLAKGLDMIFRQLMATVEAEGLKAMTTVGEPFNPEYHQAVMTVETDEYEEGIIVEELQKGYMLKDKVIRPAMVKVSG